MFRTFDYALVSEVSGMNVQSHYFLIIPRLPVSHGVWQKHIGEQNICFFDFIDDTIEIVQSKTSNSNHLSNVRPRMAPGFLVYDYSSDIYFI